MNPQNPQYNRVYARMLIGIALILGIFIMKPLYTDYLNREVKIATIEREKADKKKVLDGLIAMQKTFAASGVTDISAKVAKLNQKFDTSNIMSAVMLNDYTRPVVWTPSRIAISSIAIDKWHKLPSGLSLGTVNLSLSAISVDDMIDFITHLTQSSAFAFTIDSISLPIDTTVTTPPSTWVSLALTLGVYYYE